VIFEVCADTTVLKFLNVGPEVLFRVNFRDCYALFDSLLCQFFEVRLLASLMVVHVFKLSENTRLLRVICNRSKTLNVHELIGLILVDSGVSKRG